MAAAGVLTVALNVWVGLRVPALIDTSLSGAIAVLERQIQAFPHRERVKVLTLGNSHPQVGLRVPSLATALGISPDECFSLTFPAASTEELRLVLHRYLPLFPNARLAVWGLDPRFFASRNEHRMRYLTRHSWGERLAFASRLDTLEEKAQLAVGWWLPIMDFAPILRAQWEEKPTLTLRRLFADVEEPTPDPNKRPYRWGHPPTWDDLDAAKRQRVKVSRQHARIVLHEAENQLGPAALYPIGLANFEDCRAQLEARGITIVGLEVPLEQRMVQAMQRADRAPRYQLYQQALQTVGARIPVLRPAPAGWHKDWFIDADHMTVAGSERLCTWLATRLPPAARQAAMAPLTRRP